jgi:2'-5' RNA ligase
VEKVEVEGKGIRDLHEKLSESLQHTETHPTYKPHVTIAYVKPGLGEKYAATLNDLQGRVAVFDRLTFSDKMRNHTSLPLLGKATRFAHA